jgi:hypothetical protein
MQESKENLKSESQSVHTKIQLMNAIYKGRAEPDRIVEK